MPFPAAIERALGPLDALRLRSFRLALKSRALSALLVDRDRRLAFLATLHAGVAFVLALYLPVLLFVLAPILLGVLHVGSDVRYLVLRRKLPAWWQRAVVVACVSLAGLHGLQRFGFLRVSVRLELAMVMGWAALAVVAGMLRGRSRWRAVLGLGMVVGVGAAALRWPSSFRLVFLHAHNLVALAVWPFFHRSRSRLLGLAMLPILAGAFWLASGDLYRISLASPGVRQFGIHLLQVTNWVAPVERADYAIGLTSAFVYLQAIHYAIWLSIVPQGDLQGQGTLSFRRSARSLLADFGVMGVLLLLIPMALIALGACFNAPRASATYMALAMFHGYMELVLLLYFWVARAPLHSSASVRGEVSS